MSSRRALITGVTGQDGSYLAELLLSKDYEVHGLVRRSSGNNLSRITPILDKITLHYGDLLDELSLIRAVDQSAPHEVYNLAAMSFVGSSFTQPVATAEYDALGALKMLEAVRIAGRTDTRFYQASTSEMFGGRPTDLEHLADEDAAMEPRSPYGAAKLYAHHMTINYRERGMFACSGILFNHESPRRGLEFVTRKISRGVAAIALGLQDSLVLGNTSAQRDWGYAPEYVQAMWLMLQQAQPDDYVIATGTSTSVLEFYDMACGVVGIDPERHLLQSETQKRPTDIAYLCGNYSKARSLLHWKPTVFIDELVSIMVNHDMDELKRSSHHEN